MPGSREGSTLPVEETIPYRPCVGCGFCCSKSLCPLGSTHYGYERPCPALVFQDERYWCKFILEATAEHRQKLIAWLYIGDGCCCGLNSDRQTIIKNKGFKPQVMQDGVWDPMTLRWDLDDYQTAARMQEEYEKLRAEANKDRL